VNREYGFDTYDPAIEQTEDWYAKKSDREKAYFDLLMQIQKETGKNELEILNAFLAANNETLYVFFDETTFTFAEGTEEMSEKLASASRLSHLRPAYIIHFAPELEERIQSFTKGCNEYWVPPLQRKETKANIQGPLTGTGIRITEAAITRIHELSGGRPKEHTIA